MSEKWVRVVARKDMSGPESTTSRYWSWYVYDVATSALAWEHAFDHGYATKKQAVDHATKAAEARGMSLVPRPTHRLRPSQMRTGDLFSDGAMFLCNNFVQGGVLADVRRPDGTLGRTRLNGRIKYDIYRAEK